MAKNLYQVLEIPEHASREEVDAAYRVLRAKHQGLYDQGSASAKDELFALDGAYEILYDPERRAAHDAARKTSRVTRTTRANAVVPAPDVGDAILQLLTRGVVMLGMIMVIVWVLFPKSEVKTAPPRSEPTFDAFTAQSSCESFVKRLLKAPSTADFAPHGELQISGSGTGPWTVVGYVDAQNSFGAMLRQNYFCKVHFEGETAYPDDVRIIEPK